MNTNIKQRLNSKVDNRTAWAIILIIALIALFWGISCVRKNKVVENPIAEENTVLQEENKTPVVKTTKPSTTKPATSVEESLSYQEALTKYADRRIQLNESCTTSPYQMTFKNGTSIMLDNRSNQVRNVYIGYNVTLPAYGFKIVKLSASSFPSTILMDCDNKQNIATLIIQK